MQKRNRTRKNQKNTNGIRSLSQAVSRHPPARNFTPRLSHVFRFLNSASAATQVTVTRADLLNLMLVASTTAVSIRILDAVRLRSIQIWSPIVASFAPLLVSIEWTGLNAPSSLHSDQSEGLTPAMVSTGPPKNSSADWWSIAGQNEAEQLMLITAPVGSIVDLSVEARFIDNEPMTIGTGSAAAFGTVIYGRLDGSTGVFLASGGVTSQ